MGSKKFDPIYFIVDHMKKTRLIAVALTVLSLVSPAAVFAVDPPQIDTKLVAGWINKVSDVFFPVLALSALAMVVYGGFMWMSATGDPGKVKQAQGTLTWAIIGLVFVVIMGMLAETIFNFILN